MKEGVKELTIICTCGNEIKIYRTIGKGRWPAIIKCNKCELTIHTIPHLPLFLTVK